MGSRFHGDLMSRFFEGYKLTDQLLGQGSRSAIKLAKGIKHEDEVAVREIQKDTYKNNLDVLYKEMDILKQMQHRNVVKLRNWYEDNKVVLAVMDYVKHGSLLDYLLERDFYSEGLAQNIVSSLLNALHYCYKKGITHRDLTPECILLNDRYDVGRNIVVCNFGAATKVPIKDIGLEELSTHFYDHPEYRCPEMLNKKKTYGHKCDIWSMGIIAAIIVSGGVSLFLDEDQVKTIKNVRRGQFSWEPEENWKFVSGKAKNFISCCLIKDPVKRYDYHELLEHEWIKGNRMDTKISSKGLGSYTVAKQKFHNIINLGAAVNVFAGLMEESDSDSEDEGI